MLADMISRSSQSNVHQRWVHEKNIVNILQHQRLYCLTSFICKIKQIIILVLHLDD